MCEVGPAVTGLCEVDPAVSGLCEVGPAELEMWVADPEVDDVELS